jgi:hypothetical protein
MEVPGPRLVTIVVSTTTRALAYMAKYQGRGALGVY